LSGVLVSSGEIEVARVRTGYGRLLPSIDRKILALSGMALQAHDQNRAVAATWTRFSLPAFLSA